MTKRLINPYQQVWDSGDTTVLNPYAEYKQDMPDYERPDFAVPGLDEALAGIDEEVKALMAEFRLEESEPEPMTALELLELIMN